MFDFLFTSLDSLSVASASFLVTSQSRRELQTMTDQGATNNLSCQLARTQQEFMTPIA